MESVNRTLAQQQGLDPPFAQLGQDRIEIGAGLGWRNPAQHIIAAQADDHQHRCLRLTVATHAILVTREFA